MSRKDVYHDLVRRLLEADGWTITDDPLKLSFGEGTLYIDLGAESPLGAVKEGRRIAAERKSFLGVSPVTELERALGQYSLYRVLLERQQPGRVLHLALPEPAYKTLLDTVDGEAVIQQLDLRLILFDEAAGVIQKWIEPKSIAS